MNLNKLVTIIIVCFLFIGCMTVSLDQNARNKNFKIVYSERMVQGMECIHAEVNQVGYAWPISYVGIMFANRFANKNFPNGSTILIKIIRQGGEYRGTSLYEASIWIAKSTPSIEIPNIPSSNNILSTGSGFLIGNDGFVLTNYHVIEGGNHFELIINNQNYLLDLVSFDANIDIALLKLSSNERINGLKINDSQIQLGERVYTIGFPNPLIQGFEPKYTSGEINSMRGIGDDENYFQISVPLQPGNSGGPLIDSNGNVIGIVTSRLSDERVYRETGVIPQNVNYAIKISKIIYLLKQYNIYNSSLSSPGISSSINENMKSIGMIIVKK